MHIDEVIADPTPYIDHYDLDGVEFDRSHFNVEWITAATEVPKVIFDVGCYDCGDSIRFKRRFPECEVYSFEAPTLRHENLKKTAEKYNLNLIPIAISDITGEAIFYDSLVGGDYVDAQGSFFKHTDIYKSTNPRIIQNEQGSLVKTITIKDFCDQRNIKEIDLLYVDVEGAELQVMKGLGLLRPKIVYVETLDFVNSNHEPMWHGNATNSTELEQYLLSLGYILIKILPADRLYFHASVFIN